MVKLVKTALLKNRKRPLRMAPRSSAHAVPVEAMLSAVSEHILSLRSSLALDKVELHLTQKNGTDCSNR